MNPSKLLIGFVVSACLLLCCADYNVYDESINPTPVDLRITAVADSSVTLSWSQYKGSADLFKNYRVYFGHSAGLDTSDSLADTLSFITDTVTKVRRLAPGNLYFFRVIVTTKQGGKGASNVVDTMTLENGASNLKLYPLDSGDISDSSARLRWSACTGVFDGYQIRMDTTAKVDKADTVIKTLYTDTAVTIQNLIQGKDYWFRVYAFRDTAIVATSNAMMVQTTATKVNQQINLSIVNVTDSSIALRWNMYRGNDFKKYELRCSHNYGVLRTDSLIDTFTIQADTVFEARPLKTQTHYFFRIFVPVANTAGGYLSSNEIDTMTLENKKGKIAWYPDQAITDSSVLLTWSRYPMTSGSYKIFMDTSQTVDNNSKLVQKVYYTDTAATVNGLIAGGSYWFRIYAYQDTFMAKSNEDHNVLINPCGKIWQDTLFASAMSDSTVTLRWMGYQCNDFVNYMVRMSSNLDVSVRDPAVDTLMYKTDTQTIVRGLSPGTTYSFRVWVTQQAGKSIYSKTVPVTTTNSMLGKITLFPPDAVDTTWVKLHWSQAKPNPESYWIFKGATAQVSTLDSTNGFYSNDTANTLTNLKPKTIYWFRVFGKEVANFVDSSNAVEIVTKGH